MHYEERPGRPNPFLLVWREKDGQRRKQAFRDEADRETVARELADKMRVHGMAVLEFDPDEWRQWQEFKRMIGGADPLRVAADWLSSRDPVAEQAKTLTVRDAWLEYARLRRFEAAKMNPDTWRHIEKHVGERFVGAFGSLRLHTLTTGSVRDWLAKLRNPRANGEPMSGITLRHHRKNVNTFLDRCVREGWITRNPCDLVIPPEAESDGEVSIMPAKDAVAYFKANRAQPFIVRLAMEAFGGLRFSTAGRIGWENIDFDERGIEMPGAMHKSGKRKFRQGHPENLWRWLELAKDRNHPTWQMTLRQYTEAKQMGRARANVDPAHNVWRHSFASYLLAKTKSLPLVGYLMQHRHTTTTEIYEGVAKEADAAVYFGIVP